MESVSLSRSSFWEVKQPTFRPFVVCGPVPCVGTPPHGVSLNIIEIFSSEKNQNPPPVALFPSTCGEKEGEKKSKNARRGEWRASERFCFSGRSPASSAGPEGEWIHRIGRRTDDGMGSFQFSPDGIGFCFDRLENGWKRMKKESRLIISPLRKIESHCLQKKSNSGNGKSVTEIVTTCFISYENDFATQLWFDFFPLWPYSLEETVSKSKLCIAETNRAVSKAFLRLVEKSSRCKQRRFIDWGNLIPHNPWQQDQNYKMNFNERKLWLGEQPENLLLATLMQQRNINFIMNSTSRTTKKEPKWHFHFFVFSSCHEVKVSYHCLK